MDALYAARKYRLNLIMALQHVGQLSESIRQVVFGNVGSVTLLPVGVQDAVLLAMAMHPSSFCPSGYLSSANFQAIAQILTGRNRTPCFTLGMRAPLPLLRQE